jgi:hypothetical protein
VVVAKWFSRILGRALAVAVTISASGAAVPVAGQSLESIDRGVDPTKEELAVAGGGSTSETWHFADHLYYEPLLAEQRAARIFILFPGFAPAFPHSVQPGDRFAWQITLGREIPMVGWQTEPVGEGRLSPGRWGIGLWVPVSFHMMEDFKDESNPIVDTDYRFGSMLKFQLGLTERSWFSARFVPWAHESTHLGDEYVIHAQARPDFERVNVSYEYYEYGLSYDRSFGNHSLLTVRHGGISLWNNTKGYYSTNLLGSSEATLTPSLKNYEPSFGVEYRAPHAQTDGRQLIASMDFRYRLQYAFHQVPVGNENRRPTWTLAVGQSVHEGDRAVLRSYFGYFTHGVNPYGQLREQFPFWAAGIGWIFR